MLNGKCKEDFEKWYLDRYHQYNEYQVEHFGEDRLMNFYNSMYSDKDGKYFSMQYGVLVCFFHDNDSHAPMRMHHDFAGYLLFDDRQNVEKAMEYAVGKEVERYNLSR